MSSEAESFLGISPCTTPPKANAIGLRRRVLLLAIAWVASLMITCPDPRGVTILPLFPAGLITQFQKSANVSTQLLALGWIFYCAITAFILFSTTRRWVFILYTFLIVALLTNVAGCRHMIHDLSKIN